MGRDARLNGDSRKQTIPAVIDAVLERDAAIDNHAKVLMELQAVTHALDQSLHEFKQAQWRPPATFFGRLRWLWSGR